MENLRVLFSEEEINARIDEMAEQINRDYEGKTIKIIGILKGGVYFMCALSKRIKVPVMIDFMCVSSYGNSTHDQGFIELKKDLEDDIRYEDVLVVEDIIDTGKTLTYLMEELRTRKPASLKLCTLLDKPDRRVPEADVKVDYVGFTIPDKFVVGYGLDYAQKYRNLPYIGVVEFE